MVVATWWITQSTQHHRRGCNSSSHELILAMVFNSAILGSCISIQQKSSFCGQKDEEIPLGYA